MRRPERKAYRDSKRFGCGDFARAKICISTALISGFALSTVMTVLGVALSPQMMRLVNTPANIFADGDLYLKIYTGGFVFLFMYNVTTGIFNSLGDSKISLWLLISSSVGNIVLDAIFVIIFHWGVSGVAWATFIAQGIACVCSLIILGKQTRELATLMENIRICRRVQLMRSWGNNKKHNKKPKHLVNGVINSEMSSSMLQTHIARHFAINIVYLNVKEYHTKTINL